MQLNSRGISGILKIINDTAVCTKQLFLEIHFINEMERRQKKNFTMVKSLKIQKLVERSDLFEQSYIEKMDTTLPLPESECFTK